MHHFSNRFLKIPAAVKANLQWKKANAPWPDRTDEIVNDVKLTLRPLCTRESVSRSSLSSRLSSLLVAISSVSLAGGVATAADSPADAIRTSESSDLTVDATVPVDELPPSWVPQPHTAIGAHSDRPKLMFQPAVPVRGDAGFTILQPQVRIADSTAPMLVPSLNADVEIDTYRQTPVPLEVVDDFDVESSAVVWEDPKPSISTKLTNAAPVTPIKNFTRRIRTKLAVARCRDYGVGVERLPFALSEIDAARPHNNVRLRMEAGYNWEFPDRAEFFWSKLGGKGPALTLPVESSVDYQDLRLAIEVGGSRFSATTELPLRFIDPTVLGNTGSLGDLVLTAKTLMIDGDSFMLTQVLRNQLATGTAKSGRGNGHASMEPGFVAGYRYSERTMLHSELKLWFPLGGEPDFSGPVLRYGFGVAHVFYETDTFAILPTFEMVGWSVLNAQQTGPLGQIIELDGEDIINLFPGVRLVKDSGGEFGLFEVGVSGATAVTTSHWYETMIRLDLRWTF